MKDSTTAALPPVVDRDAYQAEVDALRIREKAHTHEGDAIAAARRRLPMVEVDAGLTLTGPNGRLTLLDAFEGRMQSIAYYFMWHPGHPAAEQCQGCTWCNSTSENCPTGTPAASRTPSSARSGTPKASATAISWAGRCLWYSAVDSLDELLVGRKINMMHIVCYVRDEDRVFETWWTTIRGVEAMDNSYSLMDLTVYGRQEAHEDSPAGWPQQWEVGGLTADGRPISQWSRLEAGRSDELT